MYMEKVNRATGYDNMRSHLVNICADELAVHTTELVNSAFRNKQFPDDLKRADISLLLKKHDDMVKTNICLSAS